MFTEFEGRFFHRGLVLRIIRVGVVYTVIDG